MGTNINGNKKPFSEINVTPFVDVMLVLLVIFMITAPLMFNGIQLTLPKTKKVGKIDLGSEQIILSVSEAYDFYIGPDQYKNKNIIKELKKRLRLTSEKVIYLRAHSDLRYGKVAHLISRLKSSGISNVALVTEIER